VAEGPALEKRYPVYPGSWVRIPPSPPLAESGRRQHSQALRRTRLGREHPVCGEMSELVEGARLEIVCVVYSGTEGSNPSLSATPFSLLDTADDLNQRGCIAQVNHVRYKNPRG
jgi:hypothetical protein